MKPIIKPAFYLFFIWLLSSCKKDGLPSVVNEAPIAKAGADLVVTLPSCAGRTGPIILDGSSSFDNNANIVSYRWSRLSGPQGFFLLDSTSAKATVDKLAPGQYAFELIVADAEGLTSRDTMSIKVTGSSTAYDLDITFSSYWSVEDNVNLCGWDYDTSSICVYYDITKIQGNGNFSPMGEFHIDITEDDDTATLSNLVLNQYFNIYSGTGNADFVLGSSNISFKKLIRDGGGEFNGFLFVTAGSAKLCDPGIFNTLAPLTVSGKVDVPNRAVSMRLQGRIYF